MTGKVDSKNSGTRTEDQEPVDEAYNYEDYLEGPEPPPNQNKSGGTNKTGGYTPPGSKNSGTYPGGGGGVAPGNDPGMPGGGSQAAAQQAQQQVQQWKSQGKSPAWIQQQLMNQGWSEGDAYYMSMGGDLTAYGQDGFPNNFPQYPGSKALGGYPGQNQDLMKFLQQAQNQQDAKKMQSDAKKQGEQKKARIHMILLQILMGDIVGAMRSYWILMDRDMRKFTREIVSKLDKVRQARSTVIRNFARNKPPKTYAGKDPSQAARAQDQTSRYTQFVQMNTQLMNELQNTERELVDALQSMNRNMQTFAESYAGMRDQDHRTSERVMTTR